MNKTVRIKSKNNNIFLILTQIKLKGTLHTGSCLPYVLCQPHTGYTRRSGTSIDQDNATKLPLCEVNELQGN